MKTKILQHFLLGILVALSLSVSSPTASAACPIDQQPCNGGCIGEKDQCILEPLPGGPTFIPSGGIGLQTFYYYVNNGVWQWAFKVGVAIAVLNGTVGGFQIVVSNGDSGKIDAGKNRFLQSAIGLMMLLLSGVILAFINPIGFQTP